MKTPLSFICPGAKPLPYAGLAIVLGCILPLAVSAEERELPYNETLQPVVNTFLDLQLCSAFAVEFDSNEKQGEQYSNAAWALHDAAIAQGWTGDQFSAEMVVAFEGKSSLVVAEDDTRESFKRRHQSGKPCDDAVERAEGFIGTGLPVPL